MLPCVPYARLGRQLALSLLCGLFVPVAAHAQAGGGVAGTVTDASGAALPGVTVTVTLADGRVASTVTNRVGRYALAALPAQQTAVSFELEGFDSVTTSTTVTTDTTVTLDSRLTVSGVRESVHVVGIAPVDPPPPPVRTPLPPSQAVPEHDAAAVCGPTTMDPTHLTVGRVVGHRYEATRVTFAKGDELLVEGFTATPLRVGSNLVVRRRFPVRATTSTGERLREAVHSAGLLQVVAIDGDTAVATVLYACDELRSGDYLDRFDPESVAQVEPSGTPDFARAGRILFADEGQLVGTPRRLMVIDRGRTDGILPGQRMTLFRATRRGRPALTVGTAIVKYATSQSATILIDSATDVIEAGDGAAPHWVISPLLAATLTRDRP